MDFRRLGWLALAGIIIYAVVKDPTGGGHAAHAIGGFLGQAARAADTLMRSL